MKLKTKDYIYLGIISLLILLVALISFAYSGAYERAEFNEGLAFGYSLFLEKSEGLYYACLNEEPIPNNFEESIELKVLNDWGWSYEKVNYFESKYGLDFQMDSKE